MSAQQRSQLAYLEHFPEEGLPPSRILMRSWPFRIGRSEEADFTVYSREVSGLHVEILRVGEQYVVRDLGSTNGTFVNGAKVREGWLKVGDVLHVAHKELRFGLSEAEDDDAVEPTIASKDEDHQQLFRETNDLLAILDRRAVRAVFQPIVTLNGHRCVGYETLGRVAMPGLDYSVGEIFRIAGQRGEGANLSRIMRESALADLPRVPERPVAVFFNLHPAEMSEGPAMEDTFRLMADSLGEGQRAVLEIHEAAVTEPRTMTRIRDRLRHVGVGLAYDDFGAGQSRLMELVEVPPDYLKLDMALIRDIDRSPKRQDLVRALVSVMRDLGIAVLAEGIERSEEGEVCEQLGCQLGQGYFYGRPAPLPE